MTFDTCIKCGPPTCKLAEAAVIVTARDFRGDVTGLCVKCGAGEDQDDGKAARLVDVEATQQKTKERK